MKKLFFVLAAALFMFSACDESTDETKYDPATDGISGEWDSKGENVAVLLKTYFQVDSIYAKFNSNNTYLVESYAKGAKTIYSGTYVQKASSVAGIWDITLNQSTPTAVTSVGIFEITKGTDNKYSMKYEVVQTEPNIGATPPTATAGFGSSSGGALGTMNIQKFVKR